MSDSTTSYESLSEDARCKCRRKAELRVSCTIDNPGRRFYGCKNWKKNGCGFFVWEDPPFDFKTTTVLCEFKKRMEKFEKDKTKDEEDKPKIEEELTAAKSELAFWEHELNVVTDEQKNLCSELKRVKCTIAVFVVVVAICIMMF